MYKYNTIYVALRTVFAFHAQIIGRELGRSMQARSRIGGLKRLGVRLVTWHAYSIVGIVEDQSMKNEGQEVF